MVSWRGLLFLQLIRDDNFALCHCLSSACADDRQKLAEALLLHYDTDAVLLVMSEIRRDIEASGKFSHFFNLVFFSLKTFQF